MTKTNKDLLERVRTHLEGKESARFAKRLRYLLAGKMVKVKSTRDKVPTTSHYDYCYRCGATVNA